MMPIKDMLRLVVSFLAVPLLASSTAASAENEPYPVWWSPELALESLDQIDARLAVPFPEKEPLAVYKYNDRTRSLEEWLVDAQEVANCRSFVEWTDQGYEAERSEDYPTVYQRHRNYVGECYSIAAMKDAKPARQSYLRNFVMDQSALDYLPAIMGPWQECSRYREIMRANRDGVPWSAYSYPYFGATLENRYHLSVTDEKNRLFLRLISADGYVLQEDRIQIIGRGDFNGDGIDDVLLSKEMFIFDQEFEGLYLATRVESDATLKVIDIYGPIHQIKGCLVLAYGQDAPGREP
jgi:hypothetical protein